MISRRPPTATQRALYSRQRLFPDDPAYNVGFLFRVHGDLDSERLRRAGARLAELAVALNERFVERDGEVVAEYDAANRYRVELVRRTGDVRAELTAEVAAELDRPIPMDRWPLYSTRMVRDDASTYVVLIASHLVADAMTFYNLIGDLGKLYQDPDFVPAGAGLLPVGPTPAPDRVRAGLDYLRSCGPTRPVPEWEADRGRAGVLVGSHVTVALGARLSGRITVAVKAMRVRKVAFFLAVHLLTHSCLSGSSDISVAIPLANRRRDRTLLRAYGYHVNTLPLSIDLADYPTFDVLCRELERRLDALISFEDVVPPSGERPSSSFTFHRQRLALRIPGCEFTPVEVPRTRLIYPFVANVEQNEDGFTYHIQAGPRVRASRPQDVLRTVLEHVTADPTTPLRRVPWVTPPVASRLPAPVRDGSLARRFEAQVAATPDTVAVGYEGQCCTYAELNRRANRVAGWITETMDGDFIGIAIPRSLDLIVATLAVLKAGRAYVPLDPAAPAERTAAALAAFDSLPVLRALPDNLSGRDESDPPGDDRSDGPAYVIFTSGSTGTPKGVVVTHRNVLRLFTAVWAELALRSDDVWSMFHSPAFDFAVWEMFGALLHGGRLELVPDWTRVSPSDFAEFLVDRRITVLSQTPSAFAPLAAALTPAHADALAVRTVVFGGEALRLETLAPWIERYGHRAELINMYGITETTVHSTLHRITADDLAAGRGGLIGLPLADVRITLVDRELRPVPDGVAGEMLISGRGVSAGYLGQPELTAERFVRTEFDGEIHYRSGDLARRTPDGLLGYLGRADRQIQLRGVRIELGEIEAALLAIPGVAECAVRLDRRDPDRPELVAFLVESTPQTDTQLRQRLGTRLPPVMRPAHLVRTPRLPLSVNGKIDDTGLPWPAPAAVAPPTVTATNLDAVRAAWAFVLGRSDFGDDETFFDAGGSSLQLMQLLTELRSLCDDPDSVDMVDLFEFTTVRAQADRLEVVRRGCRVVTILRG